MGALLTGIDLLERGEGQTALKGLRLGLLANQASVTRGLKPTKEVLSRLFPGQLKALYGPQHGFGGEDQDNMVETPDSHDPVLNIPIFSLYATTRSPLPHMVQGIDALVVDLQDVGTRVYTFASTMLHCLKAAAAEGKKVIVLDRPNPIGGELVEGNLLRTELYSFVGPYRLPIRHGLTMGEMAILFDQVFQLHCDLEVIPMQGWSRKMMWRETGLRWTMPSPNMPSPETASVYPGQVIWEGTNVSEGRGTCRPFEIFGAPYLDLQKIEKALAPEAKRGCILQKLSFRPTYHKWEGELCLGFMLHITDQRAYQPYYTSLGLLKAILDTHDKDFEWKPPPYEYEYEILPIDLILGDSSLRKKLESGWDLSVLRDEWLVELSEFVKWRRPFLLYD